MTQTSELQYEYGFYTPWLNMQDFPKELEIVRRKFPMEDEEVQFNLVMFAVNLESGAKAVSRSAGWFADKNPSGIHWHTYQASKRAQKVLECGKYITIELGQRSEHKSSILHPLPDFYELFGNTAVIEGRHIDVSTNPNAIIHYNKKRKGEKYLPLSATEHDIRIRQLTKPYQYRQGDIINIIPATRYDLAIRQVLREMRELNEKYFSQIELGFRIKEYNGVIATKVKLTRVLSAYDDGVCGGGRLYQRKASSYQDIPSDERNFMTINGQSTAEVDISSMHLILPYARVEHQPEGDLYNPISQELFGEINQQYRDVVKEPSIILLNCTDKDQFQGAIEKYDKNKHAVCENYKVLMEHKITGRKFIQAFRKVHPRLERFILSGIGLDLQYDDSCIMVNILFRLFEEGILALPLHDSIICQVGMEQRVKQIIEEEFHRYTGFYCRTKIER
ncbi:MAG: hypothetical protein ABIJ21_05915 [Nanoarchaeota archaeon]